MIESKEQVVGAFLATGKAFLNDPNPVNGIDFDDASVALKRFVLTVMKDEALGSLLANLQKLIRTRDIDAIRQGFESVGQRLND